LGFVKKYCAGFTLINYLCCGGLVLLAEWQSSLKMGFARFQAALNGMDRVGRGIIAIMRIMRIKPTAMPAAMPNIRPTNKAA
jgi:hypothetical protein